MQIFKKIIRYIDRMFEITGETREYLYTKTDMF